MAIVKVYEISPVFSFKTGTYLSTKPIPNIAAMEFTVPQGYTLSNNQILDKAGKVCVLNKNYETGKLYLLDSNGVKKLLEPATKYTVNEYLSSWNRKST